MSLKDGEQTLISCPAQTGKPQGLPQVWQLSVKSCEVFNKCDSFSFGLQLLHSQIRLSWWMKTVVLDVAGRNAPTDSWHRLVHKSFTDMFLPVKSKFIL